MTQGYGPDLSPEDRAAIEAIFGPTPQGEPQGQSDALDLAGILAEIAALQIPADLKSLYKQAWIRYAQVLQTYNAEVAKDSDYANWGPGADQLKSAEANLRQIANTARAYAPKPPTAETDESKARAELYRRQAANVGAPTPYRQGEHEGVLLSNENRDIANQKARRDLQSSYTQAYQQYEEGLEYLGERARKGLISPAELQRGGDLLFQNLEATLKGTTVYGMEEDARKREDDIRKQEEARKRQQKDLASGLISRRAEASSGLASNLFNSLQQGYGRMLSSSNPPLNANPLAMADSYIGRYFGGQEMDDLAQSILRGALGGR